MSYDTEILQLLERWEEGRGRDETLTPEALCRDCPHRVEEVRRAIAGLGDLRTMLAEERPEPSTGLAGGDGRSTVLAGSFAGLRFRPVRFHRRGGQGEVYVAHDEELNRDIALKRIQPHLGDNAAAVRRFLTEAEVTGQLEHPGVVPVYSLGRDAAGQPYYAMRFIEGESLQEAVRRYHQADAGADRDAGGQALAFRQLLGRFVALCNTIAYAHSRGIVHRDIKPSNTMLGKYGETFVVDWGLAKAIDRPEDRPDAKATAPPDAEFRTLTGQAVGTPVYMSPEQAAGDWAHVGPASDIYSLGASLYELLTGRVPFNGRNALQLLEEIPSGSFPRPRQVKATVPAALEAVCLKTMARKAENRYASALDLAGEVERWLADEPVTAWHEPFGAQARRWVRRHARLATGVGAALAVGLVALGLLAWQREGARRAVAAESEQKEVARAAAEKRLTQVERANAILASVFADLDPKRAEKEGKPLQAVLGERLDKATAEIEGDAIGDPLTVARMQTSLAVSQLGLGYPEKAIRLYVRARETITAQLGPDHADALATGIGLANGYRGAGRLDFALPLLEETFRLAKAKLGPDHPETLLTMNLLGLSYQDADRLAAALPIYEDALRLSKAKLGPDHPETLIRLNNLARGYEAAGNRAAARPLYQEAIRGQKALFGPDHPHTLTSVNNLATSLMTDGKVDAALPLFEETYQLSKARLGPDHPQTLGSMGNLAVGYRMAGRLDAALPLYEEAHKLKKARLGPVHPETLRSMNNLAEAYGAGGRVGAALPLLEEVLKLQTVALGPDHADTLTTSYNLGRANHEAGKPDVAVPLLEDALRHRQQRFGPDHPETLLTMSGLAGAYRTVGKHAAADALLRDAAEGVKRQSGADSPQYAGALAALGTSLVAQKKWADAEPVLRECLTIREKAQPDAWNTLNTESLLGASLLGQQKLADAEPLLVAGYDGLKQRAAKIPLAAKARLPEAAERLVQLYDALGKPDEAAKYRTELKALRPTPPTSAKP